jgi:hypothetical protein
MAKKRQGALREATKDLLFELDNAIELKEKELAALKSEKLLLEKKLMEDG